MHHHIRTATKYALLILPSVRTRFKRLIVDLGPKENVYNLLSQVGFCPTAALHSRDYRHEEETPSK